MVQRGCFRVRWNGGKSGRIGRTDSRWGMREATFTRSANGEHALDSIRYPCDWVLVGLKDVAMKGSGNGNRDPGLNFRRDEGFTRLKRGWLKARMEKNLPHCQLPPRESCSATFVLYDCEVS